MMQSLSKQCAAIKFCFVLSTNAAETVVMLKIAYKDDSMGKIQVYERFAWFKNGNMSIDGKPHSGRLSTAQIDENVVYSFRVCSPGSDHQSNLLFGSFKKIAQ